jgi:GNAT superfamily N-acetyltransferase
MPNFFDQFDPAPAKESKVTGNFFDQFDAKPEPTPETESFSTLRQIADVPLQLGKGVVSGVRMIADAFGAGSETSKTLKGGEDYLAGLMSAQSKQDSKEIARIMKDAEDKGVLDQVIAGVKALSVAPVDTLVNAFGTSAPAILGGLVATIGGAPALAVGAVGAGIGAAMGAGTIKGGIYDAVKEELSKTDMPKDQVEARAKLAQDYGGKNLDMILTGAAIGTLGASTGIEPAIAKVLSKNIIQKTAKEKAAEETKKIAKQGIRKYASKEGLTEFGTESLQAGQEQVAGNLALQREGIDTPLMRGVISNAVLEGLAGFGMGAGLGARTAYKAKQEVNRLDPASQEVVKENIKNIAKEDLQEKNIVVGDAELDAFIENILTTPPKQENQQNVSGDNTSTNVGTNQPSVPVSQDQTGSVPTTGAGKNTATDMAATGSIPAGTGNRENDESSALAEADKKRQELIKTVEVYAQGNFAQAIEQMNQYESPEQAFDSALTNLIDTLNEQGVKDPAVADAAIDKFNQLVREYEGRAKNDTQEEQEAARLKDIEDQRNATNNAYQEYNQSEQAPIGNTTEAKPTQTQIFTEKELSQKSYEELIEIRKKYTEELAILRNEDNKFKPVGIRRRELLNGLKTLYTLIKQKTLLNDTTEAGTTEAVEPTAEEDFEMQKKFVARLKTVLTKLKKVEVGSEEEKKLKEQRKKIEAEGDLFYEGFKIRQNKRAGKITSSTQETPKTEETSAGNTTEAGPPKATEEQLQQEKYFDAKIELDNKYDKIEKVYYATKNQIDELRHKGIMEGNAHKYENEINALEEQKNNYSNELDSLLIQLKQLKFPKKEETSAGNTTEATTTAQPTTPDIDTLVANAPKKLFELSEKVSAADKKASGWNYGSTKRNATMAFRRYSEAVKEYLKPYLTGDEKKDDSLWLKFISALDLKRVVGESKVTQETTKTEKAPIVSDKGAFIRGATNNDLMPAFAGFRQTEPDTDVHDEVGDATFITGFEVQPDLQGKGYGRKLLDAIIEWADTNDKRLALSPAASGGLTQEQLKAWYGRNGFRKAGDYMVREPKAKSRLEGVDYSPEIGHPLFDQIGLPEGPARENAKNEEIPYEDAVLLRKMILKTIDDGLERGLTREAIIGQLEALTKGGIKNNVMFKIHDYLTEKGVKEEKELNQAKEKATEFIDSIVDRTIKPSRAQINAIAYKLGLNIDMDVSNAEALHQIKQAIGYKPKEKIKEVSTTPKTEEELEEERENEFREKAEAELSESDVGKALQRIEDEDRTETKAQLRAFTNKLEKDGTLDDVSDIREALSDREVDAYDVLDIIREQLEEAKETAIEELMDEYRNDYEVSTEEQNKVQEALVKEVEKTKIAPEMSEEEQKLRLVQKTPNINELPQELQDNPAVQKYHAAFNDWVKAKEDGSDTDTVNALRTKTAEAKQELPQDHPAAYKEVVVENKKKDKKSAADKAKEKAFNEVLSQIKELKNQLESVDDPDARGRIQKGIDDLIKQAKKLNPDNTINRVGVTSDVSGDIHPTVYEAIKNNDIKGVLNALFKTSSGYTRSLAQRLLELNLNTQIFFDNQKVILDKFVAQVDIERIALENYVKSVYPNAALFIDQSLMANPILETAEAYKFLQKSGVNFAGMELVLSSVIDKYTEAASVYDGRKNPAFYIGGSVDSINISTKIPYYFGTTTNHNLLHEILHAATQWALTHRNELTKEQIYALDELTALFNYAKERSKDGSEYGFTDVSEFIAEAFSNKDFQNFLKTLKYEMEGPKTIWSRFMQIVGKLMGTKNVLFYTLANTEVLFSANKSGPSLSISPMGRPRKNAPKTPKPIATTKVNNKENFGNAIINNAIAGRVTWKNLNKKNLIKLLRSLPDQLRKHYLGLFTLDQLTDMVGEALPQFKAYRNEKDAMLNTRNKILTESEKAVSLWQNLSVKHPKLARMLDMLMIEATFAKVDPDPQGQGHDANELKKSKAGKQAQAAWDAVMADPNGAEAIEIYREVRKFYEKRMNEYITIVLKRLAISLKADGATNDEIKERIQKRFGDISADIIKPYFPIKRFGEFWLQIGHTKGNIIFMQFEDAASRDMAIEAEVKRITKEKMAANGALSEEQAMEAAEGELSAGNSFSTDLNTKLSDALQLEGIKELINKTTDKVQVGNAVDKVEDLRENLIDGFNQWYLEMMPSQSIRKMFIHRKNVPGLSGDMFRAFNESRQRIAYQRSRFEHLPKLFADIKAANGALKFMPLKEQIKWRDYVRELELNLKTAVLEPPKQSMLTTYATQAGFLYYLTAPASAIVNFMAIPGIYIPAAAPKYGMANVTQSLAKYNRLLFATAKGKERLTDEKTGRWTLLPSLARSNLDGITSVGDKIDLPAGKSLADVYDAGIRLNAIDTTLAHDNAAMAEMSSNKYTGRAQKIMYYASLPFHAAEKYNRETTFMATFDMAYRKYLTPVAKGGKGYTKENAYDAAVMDARNLVQETMFNYETSNKPRYFRGNYRNIILQFKQYPQHMTVLLWRTFEKAWISGIDGEMARYARQIANSPKDMQVELKAKKKAELEQMRKESRQQFMGMMATTFVTTGMTGLPMWFLFVGIAKAMQALFGDDDDEEDFDVDNWFKNWCDDTFGGVLGHAIKRGVLSTATGINFADRMSTNLSSMWFPDARPSNDEVTSVTNRLVSLMGPTVSVGLKVADAIDKYKDGNTERAVETIMPSAIKNVMVGTRYLIEGEAKTLTGATLVDEVNPAQALTQMLGFTPEEIALAQKKAFGKKNAAVQIDLTRANISNGFYLAIKAGDSDMLEKAIERVRKFNKAHPAYPILPDNLIDSVKKHYSDITKANLHGGVNINKKLYSELDALYR